MWPACTPQEHAVQARLRDGACSSPRRRASARALVRAAERPREACTEAVSISANVR